MIFLPGRREQGRRETPAVRASSPGSSDRCTAALPESWPQTPLQPAAMAGRVVPDALGRTAPFGAAARTPPRAPSVATPQRTRCHNLVPFPPAAGCKKQSTPRWASARSSGWADAAGLARAQAAPSWCGGGIITRASRGRGDTGCRGWWWVAVDRQLLWSPAARARPGNDGAPPASRGGGSQSGDPPWAAPRRCRV